MNLKFRSLGKEYRRHYKKIAERSSYIFGQIKRSIQVARRMPKSSETLPISDIQNTRNSERVIFICLIKLKFRIWNFDFSFFRLWFRKIHDQL